MNKSDGYVYDNEFFRYIQEGSIRSAEKIVPLVVRTLGIQSVLDVGCGAGAWLREYRKQPGLDYFGIDGDYVQPASLLIPPEHFQPHDLTLPFDLKRRFDLVQCLEVAEHLPKSAAGTMVENLVRHSGKVLFSAAPPGQGGENHMNEQPYEFWRELFARHGYKPFDFVRPSIRQDAEVEAWYRHNVILYVAQEEIASLPGAVAETRIPDGTPIPKVWSFAYGARCRMLSLLPVSWLSRIAIWKHRCILTYRGALRQR